MDDFWYNNINILFNENKIFEVIPCKQFTLNRKLNTIVRLSIYFCIIMFLINKNINILFILLLIMLFTIYIFKNKSTFSNAFSNSNVMINTTAADNLFINSNDTMDKVDKLLKENISIENLPSTVDPCMNKLSIIRDLYSNDLKEKQLEENQEETSNILDNINNISIQNNINKNLLKDDSISNIYGKSNYLRQFYTIPEHDQGSFSKWLYYNPNKHCKEGQLENCSGIGQTGGKGTP